MSVTAAACTPALAAESGADESYYGDPVTVSGTLTRTLGGDDVSIANAAVQVQEVVAGGRTVTLGTVRTGDDGELVARGASHGVRDAARHPARRAGLAGDLRRGRRPRRRAALDRAVRGGRHPLGRVRRRRRRDRHDATGRGHRRAPRPRCHGAG
ncbi:hypothetical protein GCM10025868_11980 [Angustibacter aerolatus]|uniref:DUF5666 domain-containing protein n=1 Tax=Angustibacter aerolatus TaxID=1162965 RepID=A0ABQ6JCQ5_9ACTN|nr:hypothetical protein [Angustibacter aerolatus]GMA85948.1 hypothetical protein GCM10025868_11980 [Angustibacter aerolatus]